MCVQSNPSHQKRSGCYHYEANTDSDASKKYHYALKDISTALRSRILELAAHAFDKRVVKALMGRSQRTSCVYRYYIVNVRLI